MPIMSIKYDLLPDGYSAAFYRNDWRVSVNGAVIVKAKSREGAIGAAWRHARLRHEADLARGADAGWGKLGTVQAKRERWKEQIERALRAMRGGGSKNAGELTRLDNALSRMYYGRGAGKGSAKPAAIWHVMQHVEVMGKTQPQAKCGARTRDSYGKQGAIRRFGSLLPTEEVCRDCIRFMERRGDVPTTSLLMISDGGNTESSVARERRERGGGKGSAKPRTRAAYRLTSGYGYELTESKDWRKADDELWDTVMTGPGGKFVGIRYIDGSEMAVFKTKGGYTAQLAHMTRTAWYPHTTHKQVGKGRARPSHKAPRKAPSKRKAARGKATPATGTVKLASTLAGLLRG